MFDQKELDLIEFLLNYAIRERFGFVLGDDADIAASSILRKIAYVRKVERDKKKLLKNIL